MIRLRGSAASAGRVDRGSAASTRRVVRGSAASTRRVVSGSAAVVLLTLLSAASPGAQVRDWPSEPPPRPLAPKEVSFPPYEVRTLGNGMQVMTVMQHEQPVITMRLLVRAGAAQDPPKKGGLAYLTAQLLDQGTTTKSASQIADEVDFIGGAMGTAALPDLTAANVIVMKDSFDVGMAMLSDIIRNPSFAPEEIERQKEQILSSLQVSAEDPEYIANAVFGRLVYGFHPYGMPSTGTPESMAGITRDDLRTFHRRYFVPNNMILAIVGDITSKDAFAAAEKTFGSWPRAPLTFDKAIEPPMPTRRVVIIDKPDAVQTEIRVGQLAIPRKHPDYLAWDLAVKILGGEGANRLHRVLRSERGLTYGASADTEAMKEAGGFVAETDTRTETTGQALALIVEEMVRLQRVPVSARELGDAQAYQSGNFPLTIETANQIAVQVLNAMFFELPMTEISNFRERVTAITPTDIQRVAQQYIRPGSLSIVLVGNARAFVPQLQALGLTEFEVIPIAELDLMQATLRREARGGGRAAAPASIPSAGRIIRASLQVAPPSPSRPARPAAPAEPRTAAPAQPALRADGAAAELLRRVVAARGGLEALKAVRSVVAETDTTFMDERGATAAVTKTRTYVLYPDKFRVDATIQGDTVVQIYNAGQAWEKSKAGVREMPPHVRDDAAASVRRDTIPLLIAASEGRLSVRALSDERGPDGRTVRVLECSGQGLEPVQLHVDEQMLVVKQVFWSAGPPSPSGGATRPVRAEEVFSDYRSVDGIRVPFQAAVMRDGVTLIKRVLTRVTLNDPAVDARLFARPM